MSEKFIDPRSRRGHSVAEAVFRSESARDLFTSLYKRRALYWVVFIVFAAAFYSITTKLPVTYVATARVRLDSRLEKTYTSDADNPEASRYRMLNAPDVAAEVELFQGKEVRELVARHPDVLNDPPLEGMDEWDDRDEESRYKAWMNYLYERFTAEGIPNTSIVVLQFSDRTGDRAAKLVNMLGQAYVDHRTKQHTDKTGVLPQLEAALERASTEYDETSTTIDSFRSANRISLDSVDEEAKQLQEARSAFQIRQTEAKSQLATKVTRFESLAGIERDRLDLMKALPELSINQAIQSLETEIRTARTRYHRERLISQETFSRVVMFRQELEDAETRHQNAVWGAFDGLIFQLQTAIDQMEAEVTTFQIAIDDSNSELARLSSLSTKLNRLVVNYGTARDNYELAKKRVGMAKTEGIDLPEINASLQASASPPKEPRLPPPLWLTITLAIVLGLFFAITTVFVAGYLDRTLDTPGEAERELGLPVLATIQNERGKKGKRQR
jgi:uncharacterized protein involved in exopolysaccharide biosynthesis